MSDINYDELDPGIRRVVRLLNTNGFVTSDSGDGSKAGVMECAVDYPLVVIPHDPEDHHESGERAADRVLELLSLHTTCSWEPTMDQRYPQVEYGYLPFYGTGVITIQNLLDEDLVDGAGEA